ncbi:MAG: sigma-70 family RNA polymerase sigma factor [Bacteroidia bacterium]|nr:sigma-70 family RNA polymerase sigma factor [Bacteroidia bacterium]
MAQQDETIRQAVQQYRKRLYDFIRVRVKESADAEDILQDVFYELTSTYRVLQPVEQMAAWLFRVARNKITDRYRKHKPVLYDDLHQGTNENGEANSFLEELLGAGDDPGFMSSDNEVIREALLKALEELPAEQREVFVRHELDQQSFKEISDETGVPVNTLLSRKHYAVKFLRKRLTSLYKELFEEPE